jgi:hypothetical protein
VLSPPADMQALHAEMRCRIVRLVSALRQDAAYNNEEFTLAFLEWGNEARRGSALHGISNPASQPPPARTRMKTRTWRMCLILSL